jgi:hypothetical protein
MKLIHAIVLTTVLLVSTQQFVQAEEQSDLHPYLNEKFFVDVGIYYPERQFGIRVNSTITGPVEPIDFDADFGARKSDELFSLNFGWRFGEKWQLEGQYFGASSARGTELKEDVEWKDVVFLAGSGVNAGQDFSLIRTFFARRFESGDQHEFGVGAGLHWLKFGGFIEGNIMTEGGESAFRRESVSAVAPLPNIGAWYMHSLSPKWAFKARVDWFGASFDIYDGTMTNASIGVNYKVFKNAGIGLNYNAFNLDLNVNKTDWRGNANISYEGLYAYLSFYW